MSVYFWGVRGTLPTPGVQTLRYGGNTSCVEVRRRESDQVLSRLILDAGSGIVACGDHALSQGVRDFHILFSHLHYDHIIGLTKFAPLFRSDCRVTLYGESKNGVALDGLLERFFAHPFFPVEYRSLGAHIVTETLLPEVEFELCGFHLRTFSLHHPQDALALRITNPEDGTSLVYSTDHEHGTPKDKALAQFSKDTDLFIFDSTYTPEAYEQSKGFGHSTAPMGAAIAKEACAKAFAIFHHNPEASDSALENEVLPMARQIFPASILCRENQEICLRELVTQCGTM